MKNEYFKLVKYHNLKDYDILTCVRKYDNRDVFKTIVNTFFNTPDYSAKVSKNPYIAIYELNIKSQLKVVAPDVYEKFMPYIDSNNINIDDESIAIYLSNSREYEAFDEEFANNKAFVDYIVSESAEIDRRLTITEDILTNAGFVEVEDSEAYRLLKDFEKTEYGVDNFKKFKISTKYKDSNNSIVITIDNGFNNAATNWYVYIDNNRCENVGSACIDTVWQFNTLMEIYGSKFRL